MNQGLLDKFSRCDVKKNRCSDMIVLAKKITDSTSNSIFFCHTNDSHVILAHRLSFYISPRPLNLKKNNIHAQHFESTYKIKYDSVSYRVVTIFCQSKRAVN